MVPMINFVFLLLIFFLLAGRLAPADPLGVTPPRSDVATRAGEAPAAALLLAADGRLALGADLIDAAELPAHMRAWQVTHGNRPLELKADAGADATNLIAVLQTLRDAGVVEVRLLTRPPGP